MRRSLIGWKARLAVAALAVAVLNLGAPMGAQRVAAVGPASGFRALSGADATGFSLPSDVTPVRTLDLPAYGLTYHRYQQLFGPQGAQVYGGQLTLYTDGSGAIRLVIGAHYPGIAPTNNVRLAPAEALDAADRDPVGPPPGAGPSGAAQIGVAPVRQADLMIDPDNGRYFYQVETTALGVHTIHHIDAGSGATLNKYDALAHDCTTAGTGCGVKGDTKSMAGLTTSDPIAAYGATGPHYDLSSGANYGGRVQGYDAHNGSAIYYVTDADNVWNLAGRASPGDPEIVDAQYYAAKSDDYYRTIHTFDWLQCYPVGIRSVAHYGTNYSNAFWNGAAYPYLVYGDGDGVSFIEFSGGQDVVSHEMTHGVTDCTSKLVYQNESGALNEAFSDIMGSSVEFYVNEPASSNCVTKTSVSQGQVGCADWWIGEDIYKASDTVPGFRNMADPEEDGNPDYYSERYTGTGDYGGVHTNSGIPNHAYYLLVNGGVNASCASPATHNSSPQCSQPGAMTNVAGIGLDSAQRIFFLGFTGLPSSATMANARTATENAAAFLYGAGSAQQKSTTDAWVAVGVGPAVTDSVAPAAPQGLAATGGVMQVGLTWTANTETDLAGYRVYRGTVSGSYVFLASVGKVTAYTDTAVSAGTQYFYVITAVDSSTNESLKSTEASATPTADVTAPAAPTGLAATAGDSKVSLTWNANTETDLAGYRVYRGTTSGFYIKGMSPTASLGKVTFYTDTGLTNGTPYYYVVTAVDNATIPNESSPSTEASATPLAGLLPTIHVSALTGSGKLLGKTSWRATVTITVVDNNNPLQPVSGATVTGWFSTGGTVSCTTGTSGTCSVNSGSLKTSVTATTYSVSGLSAAGYTYDSSANQPSSGSVTVPKP